ncbi:unnamed protein product [Tilletia controversa]|uniref:Kinetochore protein SPC25 n=3 Tax=Tilletia TaxID=13289 RepID=A0A8X7MS54_9BASI|nr:hypothetical protein CF336_g2940 [Tilletia laevis]KAE8196781.1 hypothetical protein CF328_g4039 [Tilletia controversa]KAE8260422.1 hypothetical protein A4X03_0g3825 [Tilletia caries]KAE8202152.1 hypothetical protein CF335_g3522 [Tilletia laevis]KAE8246976.1 hypothetical protein A4X06_0g4784 [Tilletia controversa]
MSARRSDTFRPLPPQPVPGGGAGIAATPRRTPAQHAGMTPATKHKIHPNTAAADLSMTKAPSSSQQQQQALLPHPLPIVRLSRVASDLHHPSIDFVSFHARIRVFTTAFDGYVSDQLLLTEQDKTDARTENADRQDKIRAVRRELEQQSRSQRELWDTVNDERAQDKRLKNALAILTSQHAALADRLADTVSERAEVQTRLEARRRVKEAQRNQLEAQRAKNAPELADLQRVLGCRIERRAPKVSSSSSAGGEYVRFSFGLLTRPALSSREGVVSRGMEEQDDEAWFVLDVSTRNYEVPEHFPPLPPTALANLLSELNSTRGLYGFIKQMRQALREESERGAL